MCAQVRKFKVVNTGSLGVTFTMDTKSMEKSGFTVAPDKLPLLAGAPINASLELTVTLQVSLCSAVLLLPSQLWLMVLMHQHQDHSPNVHVHRMFVKAYQPQII